MLVKNAHAKWKFSKQDEFLLVEAADCFHRGTWFVLNEKDVKKLRELLKEFK